ncbi:MAG: tetratricopeptide repeat protein [Cyanobacteria bacterium SZAS LIN-5]|nr:tetratricopeptide repeat protein [Cyanobacteria bacterium SZAS LIN-5]
MESHSNDDELQQVQFEPREVYAEAIKTFLVAAESLARAGETSQAELRYSQALRQAELAFGDTSDHYQRVLSLMSGFYRNTGREHEARAIEQKLLKMARAAAPEEPVGSSNLQSRFLRKKKVTQEELATMNRVVMPPEIRKACQVLGLPVEEDFTVEDVLKAWKRRIIADSLHPDLGGENENSVLVNTSKDVLIRWQESHLPKSRFGLGRHTDYHGR